MNLIFLLPFLITLQDTTRDYRYLEEFKIVSDYTVHYSTEKMTERKIRIFCDGSETSRRFQLYITTPDKDWIVDPVVLCITNPWDYEREQVMLCHQRESRLWEAWIGDFEALIDDGRAFSIIIYMRKWDK